jgi:HAD superfamily hydrolase (TIGR01509 family)
MTSATQGAENSRSTSTSGAIRTTRGDLQLVIFDCDGVLVETEAVSARVEQRALAELGWNLDIQDLADRFVGSGTAHFVAEVERHFGGPLGFDWHERYGHRYREAYDRELTPVPGIVGVLESLQIPFCIGSNSDHQHIRHVLALTDLLHHFEDRIFSAADVARPKPAPDVFLHAAEVMGYPAESCLVIEDSTFGARAARAAGMQVWGYVGGLTRPERLRDVTDLTFTSMSELPPMFRALVSQRDQA